MHTIGIIGISGKFGRWLQRFFEQKGCQVIGSDIGTSLSNQDVITASDVVIFSVPIYKAHDIIKDCVPFSKETQLWMDITGVKAVSTEVMKKSKAEVVALHPMCALTTDTLRGQTVFVDIVRLDKYKDWFKRFLEDLQVKVKYGTSDAHDEFMAIVQGMPHATALIMAETLRELGIDVSESMTFTSPFYRIAMSFMGRIHNQDPRLYADMQIYNPRVLVVLEKMQEVLLRHIDRVRRGDKINFVDSFNKSRDHFGEEQVTLSSRFFDDLIKLYADLSGPHMIQVEVFGDRPGLLNEITKILLDEGVSMTSIHSQVIGNLVRFKIGFEISKTSPKIRAVIRKIGGIPNSKVT